MVQTTIPSSRYDVVVVGARCAGAATAMLLARAGHRVLVVDRGRYGTDTLSTHALMRGAVVQLHRWNILPAVDRVRYDARAAGDVLLRRRVDLGADQTARRNRCVVRTAAVRARSPAGRCGQRRRRGRRLWRTRQGTATLRNRPRDRGRSSRMSPATCIESRLAWWSAPTVCGPRWLTWLARRCIARDNMPPPSCTDTGVASRSVDMSGTSLPVSARARFRRTMVRRACSSRYRVPHSPASLLTHQRGPFANCCRRWRRSSRRQIGLAGESRLRGFPGQAGFFRQSYGPGWALVGRCRIFQGSADRAWHHGRAARRGVAGLCDRHGIR